MQPKHRHHKKVQGRDRRFKAKAVTFAKKGAISVSVVVAFAYFGALITAWTAVLIMGFAPFRPWLEAQRGYRLSLGKVPRIKKGSNFYVMFVACLASSLLFLVSWTVVFGLIAVLSADNPNVMLLLSLLLWVVAFFGVAELYNLLVFGWGFRKLKNCKTETTTDMPLDPTEFERYVAGLFTRIGMKAEPVGRRGDEGIDIVIRSHDGLSIAQCKRYVATNTVQVKDVREFYGAMSHRGIPRGYFITTSSFTKGCRVHRNQVFLVDGKRLEEWANSPGSMVRDIGYDPAALIVQISRSALTIWREHQFLVVILVAALGLLPFTYLAGVSCATSW